MPGSTTVFDEEIREWLGKHKPGVVTDIGPGDGKMGSFAMEMSPDCKITGVEVWPKYAETYKDKYEKWYDDIEIRDGLALINDVDRKFGVVIFGDSLEHMPKYQALDLLEFLIMRSEYILIKVPTHHKDASIFQGTSHGNPREAHVSLWREKDFEPYTSTITRKGPMLFVVITGHAAGSALL